MTKSTTDIHVGSKVHHERFGNGTVVGEMYKGTFWKVRFGIYIGIDKTDNQLTVR